MPEAIQTTSRTKLARGWANAKARLSNLKEAADVAAQRLTIGAGAAAGGFGGGYLKGWAELNNKDMTIGDSTVTYQLAAGGAMLVAGAVFPKQIGESAANVMFGLGMGVVAGELAFMGYEAGKKPAAP